jgi:hypothetical protein
MLEAQIFSNAEITATACMTDHSIQSIHQNLHIFGQPTTPYLIKPGLALILIKTIVEALLYYLIKKPELYLNKMA